MSIVATTTTVTTYAGLDVAKAALALHLAGKLEELSWLARRDGEREMQRVLLRAMDALHEVADVCGAGVVDVRER